MVFIVFPIMVIRLSAHIMQEMRMEIKKKLIIPAPVKYCTHGFDDIC
jgi:hypothetical protein